MAETATLVACCAAPGSLGFHARLPVEMVSTPGSLPSLARFSSSTAPASVAMIHQIPCDLVALSHASNRLRAEPAAGTAPCRKALKGAWLAKWSCKMLHDERVS